MSTPALHVVTCLSNPESYRSRYRLYERFIEKMRAQGVETTTVELSYGDAHSHAKPVIKHLNHKLAYAGMPKAKLIHLRTQDVFWHKESLCNIGIASLPAGWKYVAWIDCDIEFHNPHWVEKTIDKLRHYDVVQMWSDSIDMTHDHQVVPGQRRARSFMASYAEKKRSGTGRYEDLDWHPGYAWAMTRTAYEGVGGLLERAILGAGDRHMAMSLVGLGGLSWPKQIAEKIQPAYIEMVMAWQARADARLHRNVGYVPGLITHWWHGRKRQRGYYDRWQILVENKYNPHTDVVASHHNKGLLQWSLMSSRRMRGLRDDVRKYFASRNEDSIDLE